MGVLVAVFAGLTGLICYSDLFRFFLDKERLLNFLNSMGPWKFVGFIAIQAAQVIVAPIPGDATGLLGGYLYGLVLGTSLSTLGLTLGSFAAFILARTFGRPFVEKFVPESAMKRFDYLATGKGAFLVFFLFLIPGFPKDYLCYILGLGHLSAAEFIILGSVGRLFGTILLSLEGNFLRLHQYTSFSVVFGVALLMILLAIARREQLERMFRLHYGVSKK